MNLSVQDIGDIIVVSQFTLHASTKKAIVLLTLSSKTRCCHSALNFIKLDLSLEKIQTGVLGLI
jgi:D-Tyr-tRNAtyr deacylase